MSGGMSWGKQITKDSYLSRNHWCVDCRSCKLPFESSNDSFSYLSVPSNKKSIQRQKVNSEKIDKLVLLSSPAIDYLQNIAAPVSTIVVSRAQAI